MSSLTEIQNHVVDKHLHGKHEPVIYARSNDPVQVNMITQEVKAGQVIIATNLAGRGTDEENCNFYVYFNIAYSFLLVVLLFWIIYIRYLALYRFIKHRKYYLEYKSELKISKFLCSFPAPLHFLENLFFIYIYISFS